MLSRYFRVFTFTGQVLGMVKNNPVLLTPMVINLGLAVPVNIALAVVYGLLDDNSVIGYAILAFGVTTLYFIDYFSAGLACSLIFDQVTTNQAKLGPAFGRTLKASPGILVFASVSAILDLLSSYAQERDDIIGQIILGILRAIWTTATYVVMPAMIIEGYGFFAAFKRSKDLMKHDPTQVGVGIIGLGLVTYVLSIVFIAGGFYLAQMLPAILGALVFFTMVNVYWTVSGYLKMTYYTCFYMWARECERNHSADYRLAPAPLQASIADAYA